MTVQQVDEQVAEFLTAARAPLPERDRPVEADDLIGLWHGDEHSTGYHHPFLVFAVLRKRKFANLDLLRSRFYPSLAATEVPEDALKVLRDCFEVWERRRQANVKADL